MPFVVHTIDSVLAQQRSPVDYVIIDGASTDGTVDVIKAKQSGITRWISESDEGIADAFNKGLALTSGDYILFLNADDALAAPTVLGQIAREIVEYGYPTFLYGDCDVLDRNSGRVLFRASLPYSGQGLRRGRMPPHPSLFTRRAYFERYGGFDKHFRMAMDFEWFARGIEHESIVHAPVLVTNVRTGGISTQHNWRAAEEIVLALQKNGYARTVWDRVLLRSYFSLRRGLRWCLERTGLYRAFDGIRSQIGVGK